MSPSPQSPITHVIAVQFERNSIRPSKAQDSKVDCAFDKGINNAAYTAMQYIRLRKAQGQYL